jgi:hypothetical protein
VVLVAEQLIWVLVTPVLVLKVHLGKDTKVVMAANNTMNTQLGVAAEQAALVTTV